MGTIWSLLLTINLICFILLILYIVIPWMTVKIRKILYMVKDDEDKCVFTFDDGPDPEGTSIILEILKKYSVKATFFVIGEKADKYPLTIESFVKQMRLGDTQYYINNVQIDSDGVMDPFALVG